MFEFDEHFDELEAMNTEGDLLQNEEGRMLPAWAYVGNEVWRLAREENTAEVLHEWQIETEGVA